MSNELIRVIPVERKSAVLTPSILSCIADRPTVNLTAGCAHNCLYCYARGYSQHPGQNAVTLYVNTLEKMQKELPRKRRRPKVIFFSPSSDVFQPVPQVLDMAYDVFEFLFSENIRVAILTKGRIARRHMDLLVANASRLHVGIGLTTLDESLWRIFEPNTAPPRERLAQAAALIAAGARHQVRLDPLLPGITDHLDALARLLTALARIGVRRIAVSVAFLRPAIVNSLKKGIPDPKMLARLLEHYDRGVPSRLRGAGTSALLPSAEYRRTLYANVARLAGERGIQTHVCACQNADISTDVCDIAGEWPDEPAKPEQHTLFNEG